MINNYVGDMELRHGYRMADLHALTIKAIYDAHWRLAMPFAERYELALVSIVEHLYECEEPPLPRELIRAGELAIRRYVENDFRTHGVDAKNLWGERYNGANMPRFQMFWWSTGYVGSHEGRIVEVTALRQIWPRLTKTHQAVLLALAMHGDYESAARSLGKTDRTFVTQLWSARKQFLRLWHEGEEPSRIWGRDHHGIETYSRNRSITAVTIRKRRQRARRKP